MDGQIEEPSPSPPLNPMDAFLDDLPVAELTSDETIHGAVSHFDLPTLSTPLLLLQDVGPGYSPQVYLLTNEAVVERLGQLEKSLQIT